MTRIVSFDAIDDQPFGSEICFSNEIQLALVLYSQRPSEPFGQQMTGVPRSLNGKVEQPVSFVAPGLVPVGLCAYLYLGERALTLGVTPPGS